MSKGTKMAKLNRNSRGAVSDYALLHLAAVGAEAADIGEDLIEDRICAADKPYDVSKRRAILRKRLVNTLGYIAEGTRNLFVEAVIMRRAEKKKPGQ
jgi:hypothetical protein